VTSPQFWLIAGANGSGKTTIAKSPQFRALLSNIPIFNPDVMTQEILAASPTLGLTDALRQAPGPAFSVPPPPRALLRARP